MAFSHGSVANVYIAGFDASTYLKDLSEDTNIEASETSTLNTTTKTYIPGLEEATIKASGFYDTSLVNDNLTFHYLMASLKRTITQLSYMPQGDLQGSPALILNAIVTSQTANTPVSGAATFDFAMQGSTGFQYGTVLRPQSTQTGTGSGLLGTSVDGLAATANGLSAILQVFSVTGTSSPTLSVKLQDSADNVTFADITGGAFANATASGSQYISTAKGATVRRYVKINYTVTGTTPVFVFGVQMARN